MTFAHFTMATPDVTATANFLTATLGWKRLVRPDDNGIKGAWLEITTGQQVHLLEIPDFQPSAHESEFGRHFAIFHDGAEFPQLKKRLEAHGAELIESLLDTPVDRFFFRDPNGYVFEVINEKAPTGDSFLTEWVIRNQKRILATVPAVLTLLIVCYVASLWLNKLKSRSLYRQGMAALKKHDEETALICFQQAVDIDPKFANAHCGMGKVFIAQDEPYAAESCFSIATEHNSDHGEAYFLHGKVLFQQKQWTRSIHSFSHALMEKYGKEKYGKARSHYWRGRAFENRNTAGDHKRAVRDYTDTVKSNPKFHSAYYRRAKLRFKKEKYKEAVADLTLAISREKNSANYYLERASAYSKLKENKKAVSDLTKARSLEPKNDTIYRQRADCYVKLKQFDKAISDLTKALEFASNKQDQVNDLVRRAEVHLLNKNPSDAEYDATEAIARNKNEGRAFAIRGQAKTATRQWHDAISDFNRTLQLQSKNEENTKLYLSRGKCYLEIGKINEAIDDLSRVIGDAPGEVNAYLLRSKAFEKDQQYKQAIDDLTKAIYLDDKKWKWYYRDDKQWEWYYRRGLLQVLTDQHEQAISDFTRSLEINKENAKVYLARAESRVACKQLEQAENDYTETLLRHYDCWEAIVGRAKVRHQLGRLTDEIKDWTTAIEINRKYVPAWVDRGRAYLALKKYQEAIDDFAEAIKLDKKLENSLQEEYAEAHCQQGKLLMTKSQYREALKLFAAVEYINRTKFLKLKSVQSECWFQIGLIERKSKRLDAASSAFSRAIDFDKNKTAAYLERGEIRLETGHLTDAVKDFNFVIDHQLKEIRALVGRGTAHKLLANFPLAERDFTVVIEEIDSKCIAARLGRAAVRRITGNYEGAISDLEIAREEKEPTAKRLLIAVLEERAESLFNKGKKAIENREFNNAIRDLTDTIRDYDHVERLNGRATPQIDEKLAKAYFLRGSGLSGKGKLSNPELHDVKNDMTDHIRLAKKNYNPMAYVIRGDAYRQLKDFPQALDDYEHVEKQAPNAVAPEVLVRVFVGKGEIHLEISRGVPGVEIKTQQLTAAKKSFTLAIEKAREGVESPVVAKAYWGLAKVQVDLSGIKEGQRESLLTDALESYREAIARTPKPDQQPLFNELAGATSKLGFYYYEHEQQQKPEIPLKTKIRILSNALAQFDLAEELERKQGAKKLDLQEPIINTLLKRARYLVRENELNQAITDYERLLSRDPKQSLAWADEISDTYFLRAQSSYRVKNFEMAINDFKSATQVKKAANLEPSAETKQWHGLAECQLGLQSLARKADGSLDGVSHFKEASRLNPSLTKVPALIDLLENQNRCNANQAVLNDLSKELAKAHKLPPFQITLRRAGVGVDKNLLKTLQTASRTLSNPRNYAQIEEAYTPIIKLNKITPKAYFARGLAYTRLGQLQLAALDLKVAVFMNRLYTSDPISLSNASYFQKVQLDDRQVILSAQAKRLQLAQKKKVSRQNTKSSLVNDVQAEVQVLEKK